MRVFGLPSGGGYPGRRSIGRGRLLHVATSFLAAVGLLAIVGLAVAGLRARGPEPERAEAPRKSVWVEIGKPVQMFALQTAEFGKDVRLYEARVHREGGGRQDTLAYGPQEIDAGPGVRITLYRAGAEFVADPSFFVDLTREAARAGHAVTRSAQPAALATRFGSFDVADIVLTQGTREAPCLGFRLNVEAPALRASGFACGGADPVDRLTLACALDRLDLIVGRDDRELTRYFVAAEQGRKPGCSRQRSGGTKTTWLDYGHKGPALRLSDRADKAASR